MTRETNIATQENAARHINAGEIDVGVDTLFAVDAVDHDPAPGQGAGREGFRGYSNGIRLRAADVTAV
ncbi:MAG: hypothetical protein ACR2FQ_06185 [Pseudonocardiaceae bacterium]